MNRRLRLRLVMVAPVALLLTLALSACQTLVLESQRDPSAGTASFAKSLAVVNLSETLRRTGEKELVRSLPELNLVPSFQLFSEAELDDMQEVKRRASEEGFDGLVLLLVEDVASETLDDLPLATPYGFRRIGEETWTDVRVSVSVQSLADDREVWSGVVKRWNDQGQKRDVRAIVHAAAARMRSDGLFELDSARAPSD